MQYLPAESNTGMFGGNSNWRGPVWMPVNVLIVRALLNLYAFYGDDFKVECPTGSGQLMTLFEVAQEIVRRLTAHLPARRRRAAAGLRRRPASSRTIRTGATSSCSTSTSTATTARDWRQPPDRLDGPGGAAPRLVRAGRCQGPARVRARHRAGPDHLRADRRHRRQAGLTPVRPRTPPFRRNPPRHRAAGRYASSHRSPSAPDHEIQPLLLHPLCCSPGWCCSSSLLAVTSACAAARAGSSWSWCVRDGLRDRRPPCRTSAASGSSTAAPTPARWPTASAGRSRCRWRPAQAFDIVDAAIRELPHVEDVESARDSLQVRAKVRRDLSVRRRGAAAAAHARVVRRAAQPDLRDRHAARGHRQREPRLRAGGRRLARLVHASTTAPTSRTRRRSAARSRAASPKRAATSRRRPRRRRPRRNWPSPSCSLLHAQVEPHFLYNTLGSAKYLVRSDPDGAEQIIDNLILYLRHSLPRLENSLTTLGEELERVRAYLDIMQIRMGARLTTELNVPDALKAVPFPHDDAADAGRERDQARARAQVRRRHDLDPGGRQGRTAWPITVADDGNGFGTQTDRQRHRPEATCASGCNSPTAPTPRSTSPPTSRRAWPRRSPCPMAGPTEVAP